MTKPLRQAMPTVTAWIDNLRAAFGAGLIDPSIRAGLDGQPTFHAKEAGRQVGTPIPYNPAKSITVAELKRAGILAERNADSKGRRHG